MIDFVRSGITFHGSISIFSPKPLHAGHAPYGELNENRRGASSSNDKPQYTHANASLNVRLVAFSSRRSTSRRCRSRGAASFRPIGETLAHVGLHHETVDDDFDRVFALLVEIDFFAQFADLAVDPNAREALFAISSNSLVYSPLRPRTSGASRDARAFG